MPRDKPIRDVDLEGCFLNAAICNASVLDAYRIPGQCFSNAAYREIYGIMLQMRRDGKPIDLPLLAAYLRKKNRSEDYIASNLLKIVAPNSTLAQGYSKYAKHYANELREIAFRRQTAKIEHLHQKYLQRGDNLFDLEERRRVAVQQAKELFLNEEPSVQSKEILQRLLQLRTDERARIHTGFPELDRITGPLLPGHVLTLIARPGIGKSTLASNMLVNILRRNPDYGLMFVTLEMPIHQAWKRCVSQYQKGAESELDALLDNGLVDQQILDTFDKNLFFFGKPGTTIAQINQQIDIWQQTHKPIRVVVIDYLQYLGVRESRSLYEATSHKTRQIKELAKDKDCLVILVSQVRRGSRRSAGNISHRPPTMEDARDSGTIEENADVLLALWRHKLDEEQLCIKALKTRSSKPGKEATLFLVDGCHLMSEEERSRRSAGQIQER